MECKETGGNTGLYGCDLNSQRIDGIIFVPKDASIPKSTENIVEFLQGKFKEDNKAVRWFVQFGIDQATNNSEEAQNGTLGYGKTVKQRNGNAIYQWDWEFSVCKAKNIIQFDGWNKGIYLVSSEGNILGRNSADKSALLPFMPQQFDVIAADIINIGTTDVQLISVSVNLGDRLKFTTLVEFMQIPDFDSDLLAGITDVTLTALTAQTAGSVDVKVETKCGGTNLFDLYKEQLATADAWKAVNKSTGAAGTISGVTAQENTKTFRVSIAAGTYLLSLASLSALVSAGITGFESDQITVVITE
jgi:hypothetical protein